MTPPTATHDREILRLAVPALGALAAEPLYVLVDTAVVGHLGTAQLGGLAVAGTVLTTGFWVCNFLAYGTTATVARAVGAGRREMAAAHAVQGLWLALALGVLLAVIGFLGGPALVDLFGPADVVRPHALLYLRISVLAAPAVLVALVGAGFLRGMQDTRTTLVVALLANLLNLALELLLIFGFGFGIGASALATVVAQVVAGLFFAAIVLRAATAEAVPLRPDASRLRGLAGDGVDLLVRTGSLLAALAVATAVAARLGTVELATHQVAFQVWSFLALVLDALAIAAQALVGRLLGAGRRSDARAVSWRMLQWGTGAGVVFALALVAARHPIASVFTDDPAVTASLASILVIVAVLQPLNAAVFVLDGVLIGAGDLRYLAGAMVVSALVVFVPAAVTVFTLGLGLGWLWAAIGLLMTARLATVGRRFAGPGWAVAGLTRRGS